MSYTVNFYQFNKENNSTLRPTNTPESFQCIIKRGSGLINPRIELDIGLTEAPSWNYCYIPDFRRYYYVSEWFYDKALWTANLTCDVLATYRSEIGSSNLYALRTSNPSLYDGRVVDTLYPTKAGCTFNSIAIDELWTAPSVSSYTGFYVVGTTCTSANYGSIKYYVLTPFEFGALNNYLLSDALLTNNGFDLDNASFSLQKSLIDPMQFIKSCTFIPISITEVEDYISQPEKLILFDWEINYTTTPPFSPIMTRSVLPNTPMVTLTRTVNIPKHPQTNSRGNYVNLSPYTNLMLFVAPFGTIEIDTTVTCNASTLNLEIALDLPSGLGILDVKCNGILLNSVSAQIGVPIQLSQITRDYLGGVSSAIGGVFGTLGSALMGDVSGAIMNATSGITSAVNSMCPRSNSIGSGGSYSQVLSESPRLDAQFFECVDDDIAKNGRPCCKVVNCSSGGYFLIQDGDVSISGTKAEWEMIKSQLEEGFYWE